MTTAVNFQAEQDALDLDAANAALDIIARAVEKRDALRAKVESLRRELAQTKQLCKEAEWDVGACAQRIAANRKRRAKR